MLCQKCWKEEARVHFAAVGQYGLHETRYCLACAQAEPLSWLLVWGYGHERPDDDPVLKPQALLAKPALDGRGSVTLVATGVAQCECGCRIVLGAELRCNHGHYAVEGETDFVEHLCHCGRELPVPVPRVVCLDCGATQRHAIVAAAETCLWSEQRRRIVGVDVDLRDGRATWGTFAILN